MNQITRRMGQLRNAIRAQTAKTRSTIERTARELGISLPTSRRRGRYHCICREGEDQADKGCGLQFACHQITDTQQRIIRDALRDEPALFHAFSTTWSDEQHMAILERVDAYAEQTRNDEAKRVRHLLEQPHNISEAE
jgi:hypothetical protein